MATVSPQLEPARVELYPVNPWVYWTRIAVIAGLAGIMYAAVLADMAHDWWIVPALSQGMLLPPLALYLAWAQRDQTFSHPAATDRRGLWVIGLACFSFVLGRLASEDFLTRFSFVILVAGLIWTFWGIPRLRTLGFPMLLLATMVPLPMVVYNSLAAPLQLFASDIATQVAQAMGVSVFRDGNIIQLANTSLGVEEACSGLSALSALVVGSLLIGYLRCSRLSARVALVLLAIPLAIAINVVRVAGTAVLADYEPALAMGFYHSFSGWLVFVAGAAALLALAHLFHVWLDPKQA